MDILLLGDTHSSHKHVQTALAWAARRDIRRVIQLGDFGFFWQGVDRTFPISYDLERRGMTMDFLDGNHEDFEFLRPYTDQLAPVDLRPRIRYLPRGCVWEDEGRRFMSLGGAVSMDQFRRLPGSTWFPEETITLEQLDRACAHGKIDVLLCHDAPNTPTLMDHLGEDESHWDPKLVRASANNREALGRLVEAVKPEIIVHGHYHHRYSAEHLTIDGHRSRIVGLNCNGTGDKSWITLSELVR